MKIKNVKSLVEIVVILIYIVSMATYELLFCNSNFIMNNANYNFSAFRIVFYFIALSLILIFKKKFIEEGINTFSYKFKKVCAITYYILAIIVLIFLFIRIKNVEIHKLALYIISILMGAVLITLLQKDEIKNIILVVVTLGFIFTFSTDLNHPYDEIRHFISAFNVSIGQLNFSNYKMDDAIKEIPLDSDYTNINNFFETAYTENIYTNTDNESFIYSPAPYSFILYIFSGIGIAMAKVLGGSLADMYIAGRIFNLALYTILAVITLKILPYKKKLFTAIFMIPMILVLAASYSIDGICVGLVSVFIAYCLKVYNSEKAITLKSAIILAICFIFLLLAKSMGYIGVAIIFLILPIKNTLKQNKKYLPIIITTFILACIVLLSGIIYVKNNSVVDDPRGGSNVDEQINYCKENPLNLLVTLKKHVVSTLFNPAWIEVTNSVAFFGEYSSMMFMILFVYILYVAIMDDSKKFDIKEKAIFIISFFAVFFMTSIVLYLDYTKVGATSIDGYQARYIFPILSLVLMGLNLKNIEVKENENRELSFAIISSSIIFIELFLLIRL